MTAEISVLLTTARDPAEATTLADMLLERELAACVQMMDVSSRYRWQGRVQADTEILLVVKLATARVDAATQALRKAHSYELPEIIALPVSGGLPDYIAWVVANSPGEASGT